MRGLYILIFLLIIFIVKRRTVQSHIDSLKVHTITDESAVFSLTTLPSRAKKIYPTLYSLLEQTHPLKIEIHIPERANPEPEKKYSFPRAILEHPNIEIITHPEDTGPSMKFIPAIQRKRDTPVHIISVDDDMIYPKELAQSLINAANADTASIHCVRGNIFKGKASYYSSPTTHSNEITRKKQVAIVTGCGGYIIPAPVVEKFKGVIADYSKAPKECRIMDDVWISGIATRLGVKKYVIPGVEKYVLSIGSFFTPAYLNPERDKKNEIAIQHFSWGDDEVVKN
jgi:hypothetical protein